MAPAYTQTTSLSDSISAVFLAANDFTQMSKKSPSKGGLFGWFGKSKSAPDEQEAELTPPSAESNETPLADDANNAANAAVELVENIKPVETDSLVSTDGKKQETNAEAGTASTSGFFGRLKQGLGKTRQQFSQSLANLLLGQKEIDDDLLEELETLLLTADVGVDTTSRIIDELTEQAARKELKDSDALLQRLKQQLSSTLEGCDQPLQIEAHSPFVILMVGVNGVGKTTTIGKLAHRFLAEGKSVMLAAGDTFRAAAVEQLTSWGERNQVPVIAQHTGADSASVIFDAVSAAKSRGIDIVIADTAGRLHNKSNLMEELAKVKRVIGKVDASAPHEVMLVVDAGTGQNALVQAVEFNKAVPLNSVSVTKLDGTAKGGVVFAIADRMKLPIRFIGVGEAKEDLRPFDAKEYIEALFAE